MLSNEEICQKFHSALPDYSWVTSTIKPEGSKMAEEYSDILLSEEIGEYDSWTDVMAPLMKIAKELEEKSRAKTLSGRRNFVYGGLVALNIRDSWDKLGQDEEKEQDILWMFTQLFVR